MKKTIFTLLTLCMFCVLSCGPKVGSDNEETIPGDNSLKPQEVQTFVYFGEFPKTVLPIEDEATIITTETPEANGWYKGSDGNYYEKCMEYNIHEEYFGKVYYSDGSIGRRSDEEASYYRYFKVEPIKWRILNPEEVKEGKPAFLLSEDIIMNLGFYLGPSERTINKSSVYRNNYKYSTIRAWLNGHYEDGDTQDKDYEDKGFLQIAFAKYSKDIILDTQVSNKVENKPINSNVGSYECSDTVDKIFLLSTKEASTDAYVYSDIDTEKNIMSKKQTDYAKANVECVNNGCINTWWLRSPLRDIISMEKGGFIDTMSAEGKTDNGNLWAADDGVVPAMYVDLSLLK